MLTSIVRLERAEALQDTLAALVNDLASLANECDSGVLTAVAARIATQAQVLHAWLEAQTDAS